MVSKMQSQFPKPGQRGRSLSIFGCLNLLMSTWSQESLWKRETQGMGIRANRLQEQGPEGEEAAFVDGVDQRYVDHLLKEGGRKVECG